MSEENRYFNVHTVETEIAMGHQMVMAWSCAIRINVGRWTLDGLQSRIEYIHSTESEMTFWQSLFTIHRARHTQTLSKSKTKEMEEMWKWNSYECVADILSYTCRVACRWTNEDDQSVPSIFHLYRDYVNAVLHTSNSSSVVRVKLETVN